MINADDFIKGDRAMVLAFSLEGWKDSRKSKWIRFYKTGDKVFTVICRIEFKLKVSFFPVITVPGYPPLMLSLFRPAIGHFSYSPGSARGLGRLIFMFVKLIQWAI